MPVLPCQQQWYRERDVPALRAGDYWGWQKSYHHGPGHYLENLLTMGRFLIYIQIVKILGFHGSSS